MNRMEVAVLVGLLTILGMMIMPASCHSPRNNKLAHCNNNLKQLGMSSALYNAANEVFPGPQPLGLGRPEFSWDRSLATEMIGFGHCIREPLNDLVQTSKVIDVKALTHFFTCPADPRAKGGRLVPLAPGSLADGMASGKGICRSYVLNLGTGNPVDGIAPTADAVPAEKISLPAGTVYLIESHGYATVFGQRNIANDTTMTCSKTGDMMPPDAFSNPRVPMHGMPGKSRVNALMHDGHVEALEQEAITDNHGQVMQYVK